MRKYLHRKIFAGILFFCCILFYAGADLHLAGENGQAAYRQEEDCEKCDKEHMLKRFSDWRYAKLYIDKSSYLVIDLRNVLGALLLFMVCFAAWGE